MPSHDLDPSPEPAHDEHRVAPPGPARRRGNFFRRWMSAGPAPRPANGPSAPEGDSARNTAHAAGS